MRSTAFALAASLLLSAAPAGASCGASPGLRLFHGRVLRCTSALPEIRAALELERENYDRMMQGFRGQIYTRAGQPIPTYDEVIASYLGRAQGVIVEFEIDAELLVGRSGEVPTDPPPIWRSPSGLPKGELYLILGDSRCEALPDPLPELLLEKPECCDVTPPSTDACRLHRAQVTLPPPALVAALPEKAPAEIPVAPPGSEYDTDADRDCEYLLRGIAQARSADTGSGPGAAWEWLTELRRQALLACDSQGVRPNLMARALLEARWLPSVDTPQEELALALRAIELLESNDLASSPEMVAALGWRAWIPGQDTSRDLESALALRAELYGSPSREWAEGLATLEGWNHEVATKASNKVEAAAALTRLEAAADALDESLADQRAAKVVLLQSLSTLCFEEGQHQKADALLMKILDLDPDFAAAKAH